MWSERNVNSYETGGQPFEPDLHRGKWPSRWSFYLIAIAQGFVMWHFYLGYYIFSGVSFLIPYLIGMLLFMVPVVFIQSSLGQFSGTGYISIFRIAPLFKGVVYVILLLNISCAIVYSVYTAYPLIYFLLSLTSSLPWLTCNNSWNTHNCTEVHSDMQQTQILWENQARPYEIWSTNEYFENVILDNTTDQEMKIAPYILAATFLVWVLVALVTFNGIKTISKTIIFTGSIPLVILPILLIRVSFLPGAKEAYQQLFTWDLSPLTDFHYWIMSSSLVILSLGTGWGGTLTLASFNNFKENSTKYSLIICGCHTLITIFSALFSVITFESNRDKIFLHYYDYFDQHMKYLYVPFPYVFSPLEARRMWMVLFYLMLFLIQFNNVVIQVFATLTSLFDEYKMLRRYKTRVTVGSCTLLFCVSVLFATNNIEDFFELWHQFASINRSIICLIELFVVLWVYGRLRFQRDVQFMLSQRVPSWIFFKMRFITPLFMIYLLYLQIRTTLLPMNLVVPTWGVVLLYVVKVVPWIVIPIYIAYILILTTGPIILRIKRSIRPTDWYPTDARERQKYQDLLDAADTTQQLLEFTCDLEEDFYDC